MRSSLWNKLKRLWRGRDLEVRVLDYSKVPLERRPKNHRNSTFYVQFREGRCGWKHVSQSDHLQTAAHAAKNFYTHSSRTPAVVWRSIDQVSDGL